MSAGRIPRIARDDHDAIAIERREEAGEHCLVAEVPVSVTADDERPIAAFGAAHSLGPAAAGAVNATYGPKLVAWRKPSAARRALRLAYRLSCSRTIVPIR